MERQVLFLTILIPSVFPQTANQSFFTLLIQGDGIQASMHWLDKEHFERKITLFSCYLLEKYICDDQPTPPRVNSHIASIHMGTKASLTLIPTPDAFPMYYFNFCPYSDLSLRTGDDQQFLTGLMKFKELFRSFTRHRDENRSTGTHYGSTGSAK
ncbi:hypothetical protein Hanom_Chr10g00928061 [Helianthus anomalus]